MSRNHSSVLLAATLMVGVLLGLNLNRGSLPVSAQAVDQPKAPETTAADPNVAQPRSEA